ncbi:MAG TPA: MFS transporter [Jiangellaceae bacterium]
MTDSNAAKTQTSTVRNALLAAALLAVEFIAGTQAYLLRTVIPLVGADLDAREYYGVITGTTQVAMFVTMPLGPYLLQRFRVERLLVHLTWLSVVSGAVSAIAPTVGVFVLGRAGSGLASGALATVSLAAIVTAMPPRWRRTVLAGYNLIWVFISLLAPVYAGWVASELSWRWALVLYLPLLVVARIVIARQLTGTMQTGGQERLVVGSALLLAGGVALLSLVGLRGLSAGVAIAVGIAGAAMAVFAGRRLLPAGTLSAAMRRPAAVATMGLVTGAYFGAAEIIGIIVHDLLGGTTGQVALVLGGSGLGWALAGLAAARWPAQAPRRYVHRSTLGAGILSLGLLTTIATLLVDAMSRVEIVLIGWTAAGVGIGLVYLDTLNHIVDVPQEDDGVSPATAAASTILVEAIATAVMGTLTTAGVGRAIAGGGGMAAAVVLLALCVVAAATIAWSARRVHAARRAGTAAPC